MESLNLDLQGSQHQQRALNDEGITCIPNEWTIRKNEGIANTPLSELLNAINVIEAWGYGIKKFKQKKVPKAWGYCMKKIGQKKPHLPFCMKEGGVGGFLTLMLTKFVTLKSDKK
jgi:hypothetical protein